MRDFDYSEPEVIKKYGDIILMFSMIGLVTFGFWLGDVIVRVVGHLP